MERGGECQQKLGQIVKKEVQNHKSEKKMTQTEKPLKPV
jgi:hypothetical protein